MSELNGQAKIIGALAKAQAKMHSAPKDKINPHFGSKYADFASIVDAIRGPFAEVGLGFYQDVTADDGSVTCVTTLIHESGERLTGQPLRLPVAQRTPQAVGSASTYARRYSLQAIAGVAAEADDDGNAASVPVNGAKKGLTAIPSASKKVDLAAAVETIRTGRATPEDFVPRTAEEPPPADEHGDPLPPDDPTHGRAPEPADMEIGFGKHKGKRASALTDKDLGGLIWYMRKQAEEKPQFASRDAPMLATLMTIAQYRGLTP